VPGLVPCLVRCLSLPLSLCVRLLVRLLVCALDVSHVCRSSGVSMACIICRIICRIKHMKALAPPRARGGKWFEVLDTQDIKWFDVIHKTSIHKMRLLPRCYTPPSRMPHTALLCPPVSLALLCPPVSLAGGALVLKACHGVWTSRVMSCHAMCHVMSSNVNCLPVYHHT